MHKARLNNEMTYKISIICKNCTKKTDFCNVQNMIYVDSNFGYSNAQKGYCASSR